MRACPPGVRTARRAALHWPRPTVIEAGSEKEGAAPTFKKGFAFLDRPGDPCGGEPLAGLLRPSNAGANTVADQIEVTEEALEQLPAGVAADSEVVLRFDSLAPRTDC